MLNRILYWLFTILLVLWLLAGGVLDLTHSRAALTILGRLAYPEYLANILGPCKLLAILALLYPRSRFLREWAYAGVTIDALGAFFSHLAVKDGVGAAIAPLIFLALAAGSYMLRPSEYRLTKLRTSPTEEAAFQR